jgi:hypothetical protein
MDHIRRDHLDAVCGTGFGKKLLGKSIHLSRDKLSSIAYSEQLNSITISATLQRTDRRHGIVGQKSSDFQRNA